MPGWWFRAIRLCRRPARCAGSPLPSLSASRWASACTSASTRPSRKLVTAPYITPNIAQADRPKITLDSRIRRKIGVSSSLSRVTEQVTRAAHRLDQFAVEAFIDLLPQAADMGLDNIGARVEMEIPDLLEQHLAGHQPALVDHQIFQQLPLARHQLDRALPAGNPP